MINRKYSFSVDGISFTGKKWTLPEAVKHVKNVENILLRIGVTPEDLIFKPLQKTVNATLNDAINNSVGVTTDAASKSVLKYVMGLINALEAIENKGILCEIINSLCDSISYTDEEGATCYINAEEDPVDIATYAISEVLVKNNFLSRWISTSDT